MPRIQGRERGVVGRRVVRVDHEHAVRELGQLAQPRHRSVEMVENAQRENDVERAVAFAREILDVIAPKREVRQPGVLFEQQRFVEVGLPGLDAKHLHALLGQRQREPTLQAAAIGRPQPVEPPSVRQRQRPHDRSERHVALDEIRLPEQRRHVAGEANVVRRPGLRAQPPRELFTR